MVIAYQFQKIKGSSNFEDFIGLNQRCFESWPVRQQLTSKAKVNDGIKFSIAHNFDNFRLEFAFDEMHFCSCSAVGSFVNCWFDWINEHLKAFK